MFWQLLSRWRPGTRYLFYRAKAPPAKKNVGLWERECRRQAQTQPSMTQSTKHKSEAKIYNHMTTPPSWGRCQEQSVIIEFCGSSITDLFQKVLKQQQNGVIIQVRRNDPSPNIFAVRSSLRLCERARRTGKISNY